MAYLDDVLSLAPSVHYPLDDDGIDVLDASGNGFHATMLSLSGSQYVRRVESLVRGDPDELEDLATLLNTSLSATTGVGRVYRVGGIGAPMSGSFTLAAWARWKGGVNSLFHWRGVSGFAIEFWMFGSTAARIDIINPGHLGGSDTNQFAITGIVRPDSRHLFIARFDVATGLVSFWVDGVKRGELGGAVGIHPTAVSQDLIMGDTPSAPQRPWRHYVQHASVWAGRALSDAEIAFLWNSGKTRPGRPTASVDFSEAPYADGVSALTTGLWDKVFHTGFVSYAVVEDSAASILGGRILDLRSGGNICAIRWKEAFREPQQRFLARARVTAGFNFDLGFMMLGGWDYTSMTTWGGAAGSAIEVGVFSNSLRVRQQIFNTTTTLATAAFARSAGAWFWIRGEVDTLTREVRAKAWLDADPEPEAWMIDIPTMHAAFQDGDGFFGIHLLVANTFAEVDFISLDYNSGPPPTGIMTAELPTFEPRPECIEVVPRFSLAGALPAFGERPEC